MQQNKNLTPHRRAVLSRLEGLGRASRVAAIDGHPNNLPSLIRFGWARAIGEWPHIEFEITDAGRDALAKN